MAKEEKSWYSGVVESVDEFAGRATTGLALPLVSAGIDQVMGLGSSLNGPLDAKKKELLDSYVEEHKPVFNVYFELRKNVEEARLKAELIGTAKEKKELEVAQQDVKKFVNLPHVYPVVRDYARRLNMYSKYKAEFEKEGMKFVNRNEGTSKERSFSNIKGQIDGLETTSLVWGEDSVNLVRDSILSDTKTQEVLLNSPQFKALDPATQEVYRYQVELLNRKMAEYAEQDKQAGTNSKGNLNKKLSALSGHESDDTPKNSTLKEAAAGQAPTQEQNPKDEILLAQNGGLGK